MTAGRTSLYLTKGGEEMANEQLARQGLRAVKTVERMLENNEEYDVIYDEFLHSWVEYDKNGGDIEDLLKMLSREKLITLFFIYLQQHG